MADQKVSVSVKIEELFLGVLRIFILIVLSGGLIGAVYYVFSGFNAQSAKPEEYKQQEFNANKFIEEFKESQKKQPERPIENPSQNQTEESNDDLEKELEKQVQVSNAFLRPFQLSLSYPEGYKSKKRGEAQTWAKSERKEDILAYAVGQTVFLEKVFKDKDVIDIVNAKYNRDEEYDFPGSFFDQVDEYYPDFFSEQQRLKEEFDSIQEAEVIAKQASAMMNFYIAAGLFASFLVVSLILVLVKIERNLRTRPI
jgi:hypothetical protein